MWVNKNRMAKLLSITYLKEEGYQIEYSRDKEWFLTTPQGVVIPFKRETDITKGVPYIHMMEWKKGFLNDPNCQE